MDHKPRILITRPEAEAKSLIALLAEYGLESVALPTMEIHPLNNNEAILSAFKIASKIIFISRNAVKNVASVALEALKNYKGEVLTVGASTAAELYALGIKEVVYPTEQFNSEALLELPELQEIVDEEIVIFSGIGGRDFLAHALVDRGASVTKVASYERQKPEHEPAVIKAALNSIDCIVSTSNENLRNLIQLVPASDRARLFNTPLLVISEAMVELAESSGFSNRILQSLNATDMAIAGVLTEWIKQSSDNLH